MPDAPAAAYLLAIKRRPKEIMSCRAAVSSDHRCAKEIYSLCA